MDLDSCFESLSTRTARSNSMHVCLWCVFFRCMEKTSWHQGASCVVLGKSVFLLVARGARPCSGVMVGESGIKRRCGKHSFLCVQNRELDHLYRVGLFTLYPSHFLSCVENFPTHPLKKTTPLHTKHRARLFLFLSRSHVIL